jgi:hypothetical protein
MAPSRTRAVALAALAALVPAARAAGQAAADRSVFYLLRGADTVLTERATRTPTRLDALMSLGGASVRYGADLVANGGVTRMAVAAQAPGDTAVGQRVWLAFAGDSATVDVRGGNGEPHQRVGTRAGVVPYVNPSPSSFEQIARRGRALGAAVGRPATVPIFVPGGTTVDAAVSVPSADSVVVTLPPGVDIRLRLDAAGRLLGGAIPGQNVRIVRLAMPNDAPALPALQAPPPAQQASPGAAPPGKSPLRR